MSFLGDEQSNLLATGLTTIAAAFVVIGVVTPVTAVGLCIETASAPTVGSAAFAAVWPCVGIGLQSAGRCGLRSLEP